MRVGMKIALGFLIVIVILAGMGGTSYYSALRIESNALLVQQGSQRVDVISLVDQTFTEGVLNIRGYMLYGNENFSRLTAERLDESLKQANVVLGIARPEKKVEIQRLIENITKYRNGVVTDLLPAVTQYHRERNAGATQQRLMELETRYMNIARPLVPFAESIKKITTEQVAENRKLIEEQLAASVATTGTVKTTTLTFVWLRCLPSSWSVCSSLA